MTRAPRPGILRELAVRDLGVIGDLRLLFGPGMTALTGETGAGKTMVVGAIDLLTGGRSDADLVRPGAAEAVVEGRFDVGGEEVVLARTVPREGRSRGYVNGRMATATALSEWGASLVDLHGQHAHQSLLSTPVQRDALDRFAGIDLGPLQAIRDDLRRLGSELSSLGGDAGARAREADLLRFQVDEIDGVAITGPDEDELLASEEDRLADALTHRSAAEQASGALTDDGGAVDSVGLALSAIGGRGPFADVEARLRSLAAELADVAGDVRSRGEEIEEDPARLDQIGERRRRLADLRRKYGTASLDTPRPGRAQGTLDDVLAYATDAHERLARLDSHDRRAAELEHDRERVRAAERQAAAAVGAAGRLAAPRLAAAVENHLHELAMPHARFVVEVGDDDPGDAVRLLLSANPGVPALPLAKAASGGELARAMLALRLVLSAGPATLVFDEVDAGVGGEAALAVGQALAALGARHQILVVTHLPQVAAFADEQVTVSKEQRDGTTVAGAATLGADERVVELSRMLSGTPHSARAHEHASELLAVASLARGR